MTSNYSDISTCEPDDKLCIAQKYQLGVIVVPAVLLSLTLITLATIFILLCCNRRERTRVRTPTQYQSPQHTANHRNTHQHHHHHHRHNRHPNHHRHHLQGIDAPPGIDPLEHEEVPMTVQNTRHNVKPTLAAARHASPERRGTAAQHTTRDRHGDATRHGSPERHGDATRHGSPERIGTVAPQISRERSFRNLSNVTALTPSFSVKPNDTISLFRARMDNRDVILRALKENASSDEKQQFLGFASFLGGLGPHPFIPALLGVVSVRSPLVVVMEELRHGDLLGFLWKCREGNTGHEMTEKRIFTMAGQVASALDYLHNQGSVHGNVGARSVLVGADLTAKLWGFSSAYRRTQANSAGQAGDVELKKWQAPELLSRRTASDKSDVWSFGILLYEMVTLGDPPFARILSTELLQYLQRGKTVKRPTNCSNSLYSIMKSCCHWTPQGRPTVAELIRLLHAGEKSANGSTALTVPEPLNLEKYMREAGYGEAFNYAVF